MTDFTTPAIRAGAEPFSADGNGSGVLLCHGFTGSPASMVPWGRHLAALGHTVRIPRLPGHGTTWQDMNTTGSADWYGTLDRELSELRERCDSVTVCGLSMGGALSLHLAEQRPDDVDALVLVNPAIHAKRWDLKLVPLLSRVVASLPGIGNDIKKPGQDELSYDRVPLKALASQLRLWKEIRDGLSRVTAPVLLFHSTQDHVVDDSSVELIMHGVSSQDLTLVELHDSYHVATLDNDAELIFEQSAAFIASRNSPA